MKPLHQPAVNSYYYKGANKDLEKELLGAGAEGTDGEYIDASNMRPVSADGKSGASVKIKGEQLFYENIDNRCQFIGGTNNLIAGTWDCIGATTINDHLIEFWVDDNDILPPIIRIDGKVASISSGIPFDKDHPLQFAKNENALGGELYVFDNQNPPIYLNIADMLSNICTQKYFTEFDIRKYTANLNLAADHPIFKRLVDKGVSGGLPVGQYAYKIQYVDNDGNKTKFSPYTPLIPVLSNVASISDTMGVRSYGADADPSVITKYGIEIKFRINNLLNYSYINIARTFYNEGQSLGFLPAVEVFYKIDLKEGEINVITLTDCATPTSLDKDGLSRGTAVSPAETVTDEEDTLSMASIKSNKSGRYYDNRLVLANIEYASRSIDNEVTFVEDDGRLMFSVVDKLGKIGYKEPWNHVYRQGYMGGERYGYAIHCYDYTLERSLAKSIGNPTNTCDNGDSANRSYNNYLIPNRRESAITPAKDYSYLGIVTAAPQDGSAAEETYEVFDLVDAVTKTPHCELGYGSYKNILSHSGGQKDKDKLGRDGCLEPSGNVHCDTIGYQPFHPTGKLDTDLTGLDYHINTKVWKSDTSAESDYNPKGFAPNYYAKGMAIHGVDSLPDWVQAFSIVRSEPAGRVVAQGLGFYAWTDINTKHAKKIWFYAPDVDTNIGIDPSIIDDIHDHPENYEVQFVSPLGFFTEIYSFNFGTLISPNRNDRAVDMISYARILYENGSINPDDGVGNVGKNGYVSFGKWRSNNEPTGIPFNNGNAMAGGDLRTFSITSLTPKTVGRGNYCEIELGEKIFYHTDIHGAYNFNSPDVMDFHEPVYIVNIVKIGKNVVDANINSFVDTGTYQKIRTIIGEGTGEELTLELVDERWEDVIVSLLAVGTPVTGDRFIYIEEASGIEKAWINISHKDPVTEIPNIINGLQADGYYSGVETGNITVYGVYTHENTNNRDFNILFKKITGYTTYSDSIFFPESGSYIIVRYNKNVPIRFFGGDTFVNESIFSPIDYQYNSSGDYKTVVDKFGLSVGMPYFTYKINDRVYIISDTQGINKIQDRNDFNFYKGIQEWAGIRQHCIMFTCETRLNLTCPYNDVGNNKFFPLINYIMRPNTWNNGVNYATNNIFDPDYSDDYDDGVSEREKNIWGYGGFRFLPQVNLDYTQCNEAELSSISKPKIGWTERNKFPDRVIWSVQANINIQDSPGLKTFPALNIYDISSECGEIKYLFSGNSNQGENLYAFTEKGINLLLADKLTLSQVSGDQLGLIGAQSGAPFIQQDVWLTKTIGMNDETWRTAVENEGALFFMNNNSVYRFFNNNPEDILQTTNYFSRVYRDTLKNLNPEDKLTGVFNWLHKEYWLSANTSPTSIEVPTILNPSTVMYIEDLDGYIDGELMVVTPIYAPLELRITDEVSDIIMYHGGVSLVNGYITIRRKTSSNPDVWATLALLQPGQGVRCWKSQDGTWHAGSLVDYNGQKINRLYVWNEIIKHWTGTYDYLFDRMVNRKNKVYGMKDLETYRLEDGLTINGSAINAWVMNVIAPEQPNDKEFDRIKCFGDKPTSIEFYDEENGLVITSMSEAKFGKYWLKEYDGYENLTPRKEDYPHNRLQGRKLIFKIIHNLAENFTLIGTTINYKNLK